MVVRDAETGEVKLDEATGEPVRRAPFQKVRLTYPPGTEAMTPSERRAAGVRKDYRLLSPPRRR